jgi:tRNA(fMet)-specific endonuclease VapC
LILDTNALSAAAEKDAAIISVLGAAEQIAVPVVALGEYRSGIARSRYKERYQNWLEAFLSDSLVLNVIDETTHLYAAILLELTAIGRLIPTNDIWIAALCRQHNLPLLSRDRHFDVVRDLKRVDW